MLWNDDHLRLRPRLRPGDGADEWRDGEPESPRGGLRDALRGRGVEHELLPAGGMPSWPDDSQVARVDLDVRQMPCTATRGAAVQGERNAATAG